MRKFAYFPITVTLQDDGLYRAECPVLENCWCDARTVEEAITDIQDVIDLCLRADAKAGKQPPAGLECRNKPPLSFTLPVALP